MEKNNQPRNPMENIGMHDFFNQKVRTKNTSVVRRAYWIPRKLDRKIKDMKTKRGIVSEFEIVQEALTEFFDKREK